MIGRHPFLIDTELSLYFFHQTFSLFPFADRKHHQQYSNKPANYVDVIVWFVLSRVVLSCLVLCRLAKTVDEKGGPTCFSIRNFITLAIKQFPATSFEMSDRRKIDFGIKGPICTVCVTLEQHGNYQCIIVSNLCPKFLTESDISGILSACSIL